MFRFIGLCLGTLVRLLHARRSLLLENLALRQQLAVLKRRHPRPRLNLLDKLFWVAVRRFWSGWQQSLIAVTPETVVRWLCFAKILCALKIARFPAATAVPFRLSLHPWSAKNLSRRNARAVYLYIKDGGTRTFSRRYVGSD